MFGEEKFGEWIDSAIRLIIISKNWMVLVWRITDDSPNSLNFFPTKLSRYTVVYFHLPACQQERPSSLTAEYIALNVSENKGYFRRHEPLLFQSPNSLGAIACPLFYLHRSAKSIETSQRCQYSMQDDNMQQ